MESDSSSSTGSRVLVASVMIMAAGSAMYTLQTFLRPNGTVTFDLSTPNLLPPDSNVVIKVVPIQSSSSSLDSIPQLSHFKFSDPNAEEGDEESVSSLSSTSSPRGSRRKKPSKISTSSTTTSPSSTKSTALRKRPLKFPATTKPRATRKQPSVIESLLLEQQEAQKQKQNTINRNIVETKSGKIRGVEIDAIDGKKVMAFLGVPYAEPPIGDLRFRKPQPKSRWDGVKKTRRFAPPCIQYLDHLKKIDLEWTWLRKVPSENCLYLNIWTPSTANSNTDKSPLKSVLVFIHGGYFSWGGTAIDELDGRVLSALGDIVVVTVAYRLGPFGFLDTDANSNSGNFGIHDTILALKWVKENIKEFGGDPNSITVFGHHSGAVTTSILSLSEEAKNLFSRSIISSGASTIFVWSFFKVSRKSTQSMAKKLGCVDEDDDITLESHPDIVVDCLRKVPIETLRNASYQRVSQLPFSWGPKIDNEILMNFPSETVKEKGVFHDQKVSFIGVVSYEGIVPMEMMIPDVFQRDLESTRKAFALFPTMLGDWGFANKNASFDSVVSGVFERVRNLPAMQKAMQDVTGDNAVICPSAYYAQHFASDNRKTYYYYYSHRSNSSRSPPWTNATLFYDVLFTFGKPLRYPKLYSEQDIEFSRMMIQTFSTFVRTGKPSSVYGKPWPLYTKQNPVFVELNGKLKDMQTDIGPHTEDCQLWKTAFRLFSRVTEKLNKTNR